MVSIVAAWRCDGLPLFVDHDWSWRSVDRRSGHGGWFSDELWALVEPLIPLRPPAVHGRTGRPRVDDRAALEGILFVLETRYPMEEAAERARVRVGDHVLAAAVCLAAGRVWDRLHQAVLDRLGQQGLLDWSRACLDSVSVRAKRGMS